MITVYTFIRMKCTETGFKRLVIIGNVNDGLWPNVEPKGDDVILAHWVANERTLLTRFVTCKGLCVMCQDHK